MVIPPVTAKSVEAKKGKTYEHFYRTKPIGAIINATAVLGTELTRKDWVLSIMKIGLILPVISKLHLPMPHLYLPGIENIGSTCYINAVLQLMFSLPDFVRSS